MYMWPSLSPTLFVLVQSNRDDKTTYIIWSHGWVLVQSNGTLKFGLLSIIATFRQVWNASKSSKCCGSCSDWRHVDAKMATSLASKVTEIPPVEGITQAPVVNRRNWCSSEKIQMMKTIKLWPMMSMDNQLVISWWLSIANRQCIISDWSQITCFKKVISKIFTSPWLHIKYALLCESIN